MLDDAHVACNVSKRLYEKNARTWLPELLIIQVAQRYCISCTTVSRAAG